MRLPLKLTHVPILEAVFEVRHQSSVPTSTVLPGLLFGALPGERTVQRQPAAEMPEFIRQADPNLRYAPLSGLLWGASYLVLVSDHSFGVACKLPYPGWTEFSSAILRVVDLVTQANVLSRIDRCSLKYTNIIPTDIGSATEVVEFNLQVGGHPVTGPGHFQVRAEIFEDDLVHIVQIISEGTTTTAIEGSNKKGAVIDVDSVRQLSMTPMDFSKSLPTSLTEHHLSTKRIFFSCLKATALEKLGPIYE
jgi:uncharacterized protein (TIGR04255 family)